MTKRYDEAIEVTADPLARGAPLSFVWRGRRYEIDQWLASWREAGEWWTSPPHVNGHTNGSGANGSGHGSGGAVRDREYHRVLARPSGALATGDLDADGFMRSAGAVYDVYRDRARGGWRLARIWD